MIEIGNAAQKQINLRVQYEIRTIKDEYELWKQYAYNPLVKLGMVLDMISKTDIKRYGDNNYLLNIYLQGLGNTSKIYKEYINTIRKYSNRFNNSINKISNNNFYISSYFNEEYFKIIRENVLSELKETLDNILLDMQILTINRTSLSPDKMQTTALKNDLIEYISLSNKLIDNCAYSTAYILFGKNTLIKE